MTMDETDWRIRAVLGSFNNGEIVRYFNLPAGVGHKTMAILVERGCFRQMNPGAKRGSQDEAWERVA